MLSAVRGVLASATTACGSVPSGAALRTTTRAAASACHGAAMPATGACTQAVCGGAAASSSRWADVGVPAATRSFSVEASRAVAQAGLDIDDLFDTTPKHPTFGSGDDAGNDGATSTQFQFEEYSSLFVDEEFDTVGPVKRRSRRNDPDYARLVDAGLGYSVEELTENPKLKRLEKYQLMMLDGVDARNFAQVLEGFKRLVAKGHSPDVRTFNILLAAAGRSRRRDLLFKYVRMMMESGLDPDTTTFNIMIRTMGRFGDLKKAVELYKLMRQPFSEYNTPPDAQTYTNMMRAALLADEPVVAFKYYNVMVHEGFPPKEVHFYMLFQYLFQAKNYEYCAAVFRTMQNYQRHFVPSLELCTFLQEQLRVAPQMGRELWAILHRRAKLYPSSPPSVDILQQAFDSLVGDGMFHEARRLAQLSRTLDTVSDEQAEEFDFQAGKLTAADEYTNLGWGPDGTESVGPTIGSFGEEDFGLEDLEEDETAPRFQAGGYLASAKKARGRGGRGSGGGRGGGRGGRASGRRK